jgi:hypothetical protein
MLIRQGIFPLPKVKTGDHFGVHRRLCKTFRYRWDHFLVYLFFRWYRQFIPSD